MSDIDDRLDRLESLVEQQQETIKEQRERIAELEGEPDGDANQQEALPAVTRRRALTAGGLLALLFGGVGTASSDSQGQIGTENNPLTGLFTEELTLANSPYDGSTDETVSTLAGQGLSIGGGTLSSDLGNGLEFDGSGQIAIPSANTDTRTETLSLPSTLTASRGSGSGTGSEPGDRVGIKFVPQYDTNSVTITTDSDNDSGLQLYVTDTSGNVLAQDASSPGASTQLTASLSAGTGYYAVVDNGGSSYNFGAASSPTFPYTSDAVNITKGVINNTYEWTDTAPAIQEVSLPTGYSDSIVQSIEFADPTPVGRWETASFQADEDTETVEVYVETDDGNGWSDWQSDPIASGTNLSSISPDSRVRFRVEISRSDSSNNPRLLLLSRQYRP
jgi:hypothetical protein